MCANEAQRHEWRAAVLGFIRDHIEPAEIYRLGEADLAFGELLPEKPGWSSRNTKSEPGSDFISNGSRRESLNSCREFAFTEQQVEGEGDSPVQGTMRRFPGAVGADMCGCGIARARTGAHATLRRVFA